MRKVGNGQRLCNCANIHFWGATHRQGDVWKADVNFYLRVLYNTYVVVNIVAKYIVKKLAMVKVCNCANSQFKGSHRQGRHGKGMLISCEKRSQCLCWVK